MIHHHECRRCTHQWCSSCMGEMLAKPEEKERNSRQTISHLCWDCFEKLENGDFGSLREIYYLYHKLLDRSWSNSKLIKFICEKLNIRVQEISQIELNEYSTELSHVVNYLGGVYENLLKEIRTPARIELDILKDEHRKGLTPGEAITEFWNGGWRPEGFVGDSPGEERVEVLFGLDLAKGNLDIIAPTLKMNNGSDSCKLTSTSESDSTSRT